MFTEQIIPQANSTEPFLFPRREMQTASRYASRTSASLGEGVLFYYTSFWTMVISSNRAISQQAFHIFFDVTP